MARALGDFQTPPALVDAILDRVAERGPFQRALEPTCGRGHFIDGLLRRREPPAHVIGIELQSDYVAEARALGGPVEIRQGDVFEHDLHDLDWPVGGPLLVVGNPPWVTNAELGALGSSNRPARRRLRGLSGLAARTGASNFDLAEAVWLKVIEELADEAPTVALLCKQTVARRVIELAWRQGVGLSDVAIYSIDGRRWFDAQVDACLMVAKAGGSPDDQPTATTFASLDEADPSGAWGLVDGRLVADWPAYRQLAELDGSSPVVWRQGVKHDASKIMVLRCDGEPGQGDLWRNGLGDVVDVEPDVALPLLNATDLAHDRWPPRRRVIITQRHLGDDPERLATDAPKAWAYLCRHGERLDARKSSIYRGRPRFSMFGVGDYTFASWKVAVSGLHAPPRFRVVGPLGDHGVVVDDTCYLVACRTPEEAGVLGAALRSQTCLRFLAALTFSGAKRPINKRLLSRLDVAALVARLDGGWLADEAGRLVEEAGGSVKEGALAAAIDDLRALLGGVRQTRIAFDERG